MSPNDTNISPHPDLGTTRFLSFPRGHEFVTPSAGPHRRVAGCTPRTITAPGAARTPDLTHDLIHDLIHDQTTDPTFDPRSPGGDSS